MNKKDIEIGRIYKIRRWEDMVEKEGEIDTFGNNILLPKGPDFNKRMKEYCEELVRVKEIDCPNKNFLRLDFIHRANDPTEKWNFGVSMIEPLHENKFNFYK